MTHVEPTKTSPAKAVIGAVVALVLLALAPIVTTVDAGDPVTLATWLHSLVAGLGGAALVFPSVYFTTNKPIS